MQVLEINYQVLLNQLKYFGNLYYLRPFDFRVDFSHLNEHKFRYNFADTLNPLWSCSLETKSMAVFFLDGRNYTNIRITLMNELNDIDYSITLKQPNALLRIILYNDCKFKDKFKKLILIVLFCKNNIKDYTQPLVTFLLHFSGFLFFEYVYMYPCSIEIIRKSFCIVQVLFFFIFGRFVNRVTVLQKKNLLH